MEEESYQTTIPDADENINNRSSAISLIILSAISFSVVILYIVYETFVKYHPGLSEAIELYSSLLPLIAIPMLLFSKFISTVKTEKHDDLRFRVFTITSRSFVLLLAGFVIVLDVFYVRYIVPLTYDLPIIAPISIFESLILFLILLGIWQCLGSRKLFYGKRREKTRLKFILVTISILASFLITFIISFIIIIPHLSSLLEPFFEFYYPFLLSFFSLSLAILVLAMKTSEEDPNLLLNA